MATTLASPPHIASLLSSSATNLHSNSSFCLPTRTRIRTSPLIQTRKSIIFHHPPFLITQTSNNRLGSIGPVAAAEDVVVPSDAAAAVDAAQELVSTNTDDGVSTFISALLFVAFIGLSLLTIGVIYLGVTDFLQKREKEKFEKEEAAANKSGKKKKKKTVARARAGPRGFGQKIEEDDVDDD